MIRTKTMNMNNDNNFELSMEFEDKNAM